MKDEIIEVGGAEGEKTCQEISFSTNVAASRGAGDQAIAISETINPMTKKVSGKFDRTKVMAARMKSAMTVDAYRRETGLTTSLPCAPNCRASWRSSSHE